MDTKASSVVLPYLSTDVPYALPTDAEIEDLRVVFSDYGNRKIVRVGRYFVVKYGEGIDLIEGENMLYVRKVTTIKVPKVYALYTESCTGKNFIIIEFVEGDTLASTWPDFSATQKSNITIRLRDSYDRLRRLPSPGYFCSLGKRPLLDGIFWTREKIPSINGPFETEHALNEAMAQKYVYDGRESFKADYYRQSLPYMLRDHRPTFARADCQRKNIMVRRLPSHKHPVFSHRTFVSFMDVLRYNIERVRVVLKDRILAKTPILNVLASNCQPRTDLRRNSQP